MDAKATLQEKNMNYMYQYDIYVVWGRDKGTGTSSPQ